MTLTTPPPSSQRQLDILHTLARLLESSLPLSQTLHKALAILTEGLGMMRGVITLITPRTGKIRIEASYGLNAAQRKRGEYAPGEGITGKVIASGEPMFISDVSQEPLFLNRTGSRNLAKERISFICVPIRLHGEILGALSVDQLSADNHILEEEVKLLQIVSTLLAYATYESQAGKISIDNEAPKGIVGNSESMRQVYAQINIVAPSNTTVFIQGESGTGKELVARAIHEVSQRPNGPFISLNCAALPENLIESELFGHERGAFTGATQTRKGRFELAKDGTLFLDEIGELSPLVQAKLLRVLQEKTFERLGGMETIRADVRVIAATNRNLSDMVDKGIFRRDLYYRLNVFPLSLPPLRERIEDIPALANCFLEKFAKNNSKKCPKLSVAALELLQQYTWPGNVRELQNIMERALLLVGRENIILPRHLPPALQPRIALPIAGRAKEGNLREHLDEVEYSYIRDALAASDGHINKAAALLGLTERIMALRLKKYGLDYKIYRKQDSK